MSARYRRNPRTRARAGALLALVPVALPVLGVDGDDGLARLREGWHALNAVPGMAPFGDGASILDRPPARRGERYHRVRSETDAGGISVGPDDLRPGLGEAAAGGALGEKAQPVAAVAVAVATRDVDGSDEGGGEPPASSSAVGWLVWLLVSLRFFCCDAA